ncbi:trypsin 3A1-like [Arctopsyche grandis]|uniref:trypsin 3A1-like n=1 Tax=Arctopsyche grandis TaxID=121162 RepID=UPI00406D8237
MKIYLALILILGVFVGSSVSAIESRIIGGTPQLSPVIHAVSVQNSQNKHVCGGTIINTRWILTSATCATSADIKTVVFGETSLSNPRYIYTILSIVMHRDYNAQSDLNNIAAIQTLQTIVYGSRVGIATLSTSYIGSGIYLSLSGWGITNKTDPNPSITLQQLNMHSISRDECSADIVPRRVIVDQQLCGIRATGRGVCTGDTGSGVTWGNCLYGIVGKTPSVQDCAAGNPQVFLRITYYRAWITQATTTNFTTNYSVYYL